MAEGTSIEWATHTFNTHWGCAEVSPGCDHCYARDMAHRFGTEWGVDAPRREFGDAHWAEPLKWDRKAAAAGERHRVFSNSMSDLFDKNAPAGVRERWFALTKATPHLDWLALTKRIGNVAGMLPDDWGDGYPNVWLGATVVNQEEASRDIPKLLATPAALRFLSIEPMLGPVDLADIDDGAAHREIPRSYWTTLDTEDSPPSLGLNALTGARWQRFGDWESRGPRIDWIIAGGESGHHARPASPDWFRTLRDECAAAGVPYLFKQWGEWVPMLGQVEGVGVTRRATTPDGWVMGWAGKKAAGRRLDGRTHDEFPEVHRG